MQVYEKIGMPALIIQVLSGLWLAFHFEPDISLWFDFNNEITCPIRLKILLLFLTSIFAIDAKFRIIPNLLENNLLEMALHIIPVTAFSILFAIISVAFRIVFLGYSLL